jgi:hypothetical protein
VKAVLRLGAYLIENDGATGYSKQDDPYKRVSAVSGDCHPVLWHAQAERQVSGPGSLDTAGIVARHRADVVRAEMRILRVRGSGVGVWDTR